MNTNAPTESPKEVRFAHFQFDPKADRLGEGNQCEVFRAVDALSVTRHAIQRRPQCPGCGDSRWMERQMSTPIRPIFPVGKPPSTRPQVSPPSSDR